MLKKMLGIIRTCGLCGQDYHKDDARCRSSNKQKLTTWKDGSGNTRLRFNSVRHECCRKCFIKMQKEKSEKILGTTDGKKYNSIYEYFYTPEQLEQIKEIYKKIEDDNEVK